MNSVVKSSWKNCLHWHGLGLSASATCRGPARRWMPLTSPQVHAVWGHEIKFIKVFRFLEKKNGSLFSPSLSTTKTRTHWKRPWCWERLKVGGEGDDRGWDSWMASPTGWTRVWASSRSWWWTGKPGVLQSMELQRVGHDWLTELNWTNAHYYIQKRQTIRTYCISRGTI